MMARTRGSPIDTFGAADLLVRDARGAWQRHHAGRSDGCIWTRARHGPRVPRSRWAADTLPDVVLEVDNTTDVAPWQARTLRVVGISGSVGGGT